jgi:FRG domain
MAKIVISRASEVRKRIRLRQDALAHFTSFIDWVHEHASHRWVFRGQPNHWALKPTVGRSSAYKPEVERLLLDEFKRSALPHLDRNRLTNNWDWLAVAQHHGLPTRLLDWTTNPLVACFFATSIPGKSKQDGEINAFQASEVGYYSPENPDEIDPFSITKPGFFKPSALASRIVSQRGLFSIQPTPDRAWYISKKTVKFLIPVEYKPEFRRALFNMGADSAFIMSDLDGLASTLKWRFENRILGE